MKKKIKNRRLKTALVKLLPAFAVTVLPMLKFGFGWDVYIFLSLTCWLFLVAFGGSVEDKWVNW